MKKLEHGYRTISLKSYSDSLKSYSEIVSRRPVTFNSDSATLINYPVYPNRHFASPNLRFVSSNCRLVSPKGRLASPNRHPALDAGSPRWSKFLIALFSVVMLSLSSCSGDEESVESASTSKESTAPSESSSTTRLDLSNVDRKDPHQQYLLALEETEKAFERNPPSFDPETIGEVATEHYINNMNETFKESVEQGWSLEFKKPLADSVIEMMPIMIEGFYNTNDDGTPIHYDGQLIIFRACLIEETKLVNTETGEISEDIYTREAEVQMQYQNDRWLITNDGTVEQVGGQQECNYSVE